MLAVDLSGRVALVTGAARGLGLGIAGALHASGARVVINDLDANAAANAANQLGPDALCIAGDVTSESDCDAMVAAALAQAGALHIVVNNAGIGAPPRPTAKQELDAWQRVMDVNLRGTFLMSRAAIRHFSGSGSGAIVNISSVAGLGPMPASNDYGVSKAAVAMLTRTMAADVGRRSIRVNCVAPGFCDAPMLRELEQTNPSLRDAYLTRIPLRRFGRADEIGAAVAFLCSDLAMYITGAVVPVDGGWSSNAGP